MEKPKVCKIKSTKIYGKYFLKIYEMTVLVNSISGGFSPEMREITEQSRKDFFYYVWLFFLMAVFGWLWEGFLYLFKDDMYVNRGFLTGPWLPIYGMGAVMLELLFHRWRNRPIMIFVSSMLICTVLEYLTGWYLELTWEVKWWDYSEMPWNLHGRICILSSLLFGAGGMLLVWVVSPLLCFLYQKVPVKARAGIGLLVLGLFVADAAYSAISPHVGAGVIYR